MLIVWLTVRYQITRVAVFSDIETAKSTDYKFKSGQICYKGCVFMGGNVVARNGFIRVKNPAA